MTAYFQAVVLCFPYQGKGVHLIGELDIERHFSNVGVIVRIIRACVRTCRRTCVHLHKSARDAFMTEASMNMLSTILETHGTHVSLRMMGVAGEKRAGSYKIQGPHRN